MNFYYAKAGAPHGPVSRNTIDALFARGEIDRQTLVWQEGWPDWQPYYQISNASGERPILPRLPAASALQEKRGGPVLRLFARMLDIELALIPVLVLFVVLQKSGWIPSQPVLETYDPLPDMALFCSAYLFNAILAAIFGNSPGKKILGLRPVRSDGSGRLGLVGMVKRELSIYLAATSFTVPGVFGQIYAFRVLRSMLAGKRPPYDRGRSDVLASSIGKARMAAGILVPVMLLAGALVLADLGEQLKRKPVFQREQTLEGESDGWTDMDGNPVTLPSY
ncbi:RDD family protein [Faunimonas pinastri]|uniref:RDD family protein n=1 Tax=Faunimonas pinastri TaxID=1855383 RepID=A0A1H9GQN7_9HYPH|nr:RDD family protein [Faunimonas pinastri]SEQ52288.1 RDD family protein [Faunimonas pinastri]